MTVIRPLGTDLSSSFWSNKPTSLVPWMSSSARQQVALNRVVSARQSRLLEMLKPTDGVLEQPASTEAWLQAAPPQLLQRRLGRRLVVGRAATRPGQAPWSGPRLW